MRPAERESPLKVRKDFGKNPDRICYEFGPFRVDASERLVWRDGKRLPLTPKVFNTLLVLLQNAGRILTKEELMQRVWPDTAVEESNLARNVSTLRKLLGEERDEQHYIETIPWRGYRFAAEIRELRDESGTIDSLAVLPLINESPDPATDYLADGITESLIHKLSRVSGLKVMSRHSVFQYKERPDAETVGRELGVRAVLTGRVRLIADVVLVSVELVDAGDNSHLWGGQYNRELANLVTMPETIAQQIAELLKLNLTGADKHTLSARPTGNPEAYQCYLKGRYFWNKLTLEDIQKALGFFKQAIDKDPGYALAYGGLLDCYTYMQVPVEARKAAVKALELDPTLGEVHASLGFFKFLYDWDFAGAELELKKAVELTPNYAQARHWYAIYLANMGRREEAIDQATRARDLDPLSALMNQTAGNVLMLARDYDGATDALLNTLDLDPRFAAAHSVLGCVYCLKGMHEESLAQFEKVRALAGRHPGIDASIKALEGWVYAASGNRSEALKAIEAVSNPPGATPYSIAAIHAALGENDRAFELLDSAYQARSFQLVSLKVDPSFESLHSDPRFQDLSRRVGLPEH